MRSLADERVGEIGIHAFSIAFEPGWDVTELDPGRGNTVTFRRGVLGEEDCKALVHIWTQRCHIMCLGKHSSWHHAISLASDWSYLRNKVGISESLRAVRREMAEKILNDIAASAQGRLGVQHKIAALARSLKYNVKTQLDPEFEILFPSREDPARWREQHQEWFHAATKLAPSWAERGAEVAANRVASFELEARIAGITWPRLTTSLFEAISKTVPDQQPWISALMAVNAPGDLVRPFLKRFATSHPEREAVLAGAMENETYRHIGVELALTTPTVSAGTIGRAIATAATFSQLVETCCLLDEVPVSTLERLITAENPGVSLAAAIGEWNGAKRTSRNIRLPDQWRKAILRSAHMKEFSNHTDYWIGEIFEESSGLAFEWLVELDGTDRRYLE